MYNHKSLQFNLKIKNKRNKMYNYNNVQTTCQSQTFQCFDTKPFKLTVTVCFTTFLLQSGTHRII